ncbi:ROK family protein [Paenibacillus sp. LMG 31460]|uniref:ROK family protein n=1 Tax=Paenibacillus germinis TaxID=2654979 RepID=A0ABX1Z8U6_9BACL|nr:ROK family transcriptional regulator [Paenibacillus germinis]NOU88779.1 ROK family protein [Paenibacillus germinis]
MNENTSSKWLKSVNQQKVLRLIYAEGPISRVNLAEKTGLTPQTITNIVNRLLREDILQENVPLENGVGRKPVPLVVKSGNLFAIGIEVAVKYVRGTLVDFRNVPICEVTETMFSGGNEDHDENKVECIVKVIDQLLKRVPKMNQLKGIGCSIQGLVDSTDGVVLLSSGLHWRNFPLRERLEQHYNLPVYLENDANLLALVENLNGSLAASNHNVTVKLDYGIGGAHVMNKQLNSGAGHVAGELGHCKTFFGIEALPCHCGAKGCLTTLVSGSGMKRNLGFTLEEFGHRIREGDPVAREWLAKMAEAVSSALSNLITFLNPDHVLFTGKVLDHTGNYLMDPLRKRILENIPESCRKVRLLRLEQTPDDSVLAAGLVMNRFFDVPPIHLSVI